jgi:hypothetical protein
MQKHVLALTMASWDLLQPLRYFPLMPRPVPCSGGVAPFSTEAWSLKVQILGSQHVVDYPIITNLRGESRYRYVADVLPVLAHLFFRWGSIVSPFPHYPVDNGILQSGDNF